MAWQKRIYYARSVRRGDRVVSHYVGGGPVGARAEAYDRCTRAARVDLLTQVRAECARLELLEQPLEHELHQRQKVRSVDVGEQSVI